MEYAETSVEHVAGLGYATKLGVGSDDLARDVRVGVETRWSAWACMAEARRAAASRSWAAAAWRLDAAACLLARSRRG